MSEPLHRASHAALLAAFTPGRARLGGIVTPATRTAESVLNPIKLGAQLGVPVVVLCSKGAQPAAIAERAGRVRGAQCAIVDLDRPYKRDALPAFRTDRFADATFGSYGDLSAKRNLGLLIARIADWQTVLFLDDDLFGLSGTEVRRAVGSLEHHTAVGMPATDYPDNSVVCHARRFTSSQDVFVSGSALAVNVQAAESFFPRVYNEDWFFLAPLLGRREVSRHGKVRQEFFDPFDRPVRAAKQEFGDVLAEGLVGHLHGGSLEEPPSEDYWRAFLLRRAETIAEAAAGCRKQKGNPVARDALRSLDRAEATRATIRPRTLAAYVRAWQKDLEDWRKHLVGVPRAGCLQDALDDLELRHLLVPPRRRVILNRVAV